MRILALLALTACTSEAQQALDEARALWEAEGTSSYTYTAINVQCPVFCDPGRWEVVVTDDEVSLRREIEDGGTPAGVLQGIPRAFDHIQGILDGRAVDEEITLDGVGGLHMSFWHCEGCDDSGAILSLTGYTPLD
ncbi:MAG: hypothetical protein KC656_18860 [Myxococcales bacterium]|nr:hypothetical protein [Myxococcales bacterium]